MSSSHGDKRISDVEMGEATSPAPILTYPVEAPACDADHLSFQERLVRSGIPDALALPAGSSTTPILVEERAADSMPPPPARKEIVLALHAPSVVPVAQPKGRKRKFTKGGDGESSQQGGSSIASGLRGKRPSLARARSLRSDRAEHAFGRCVATFFELLSDVSCFLRKAFPPQLVRVETLARGLTILAKLGVLDEVYFKLRRRKFLRNSKSFAFNMSSSHGDKRSSDVEMGEATSPAPIPTYPVEALACVADHLSFRERLVRRQAEKEQVRAGAEFPSSSALAIAPGHGAEVVTPRDAGTLVGSGVRDASAPPAGSSMTPILVEDKERAAHSMRPPPARKEIVLALHAPSVVLVAQPKGRKRKFTKGGDGESSQQEGSSIASGIRGKFMSLIDGMIIECGSETSHLAGELLELQGELERDLGKTASSLLKEKKPRKAKSSKVRRLQRQIEGDAGLASRGIREATDALRSEFQARLAKISAFLGSLECIRNRDLALATIEGGVAVVQSFQSETPPTLETEEAQLQGKGSVGKGPVLGEGGGDTAPCLDEATGEEGAFCAAEKEQVRAGAEFPSSSTLAIAPGHRTEVVTPRDAGTLAGSGVPDASALPAGSSTILILVEDKQWAADSMPPPPARKEIVLALHTPSVVPVSQPKGRKRKSTKGGDENLRSKEARA
ncbi:hypothetical protein F2Q70_00005413 [Brassica cretica]|uniref:Uncharacterized protein n=1 Tax=Brassica cretica TaxID=69181 RepID=A0A8S9J2U0_BRACR|nr:hypothetical protein F2Q70_00005413 [Brassica cretica]